jgi:uncharacterized phage-associated protein
VYDSYWAGGDVTVGGAISLVDGSYRDIRIPRKINIFDAANYFISLAKLDGGNIMTIIGLQKLCFYTQAWSLVWDLKPMFDEEFESGEHGPFNHALLEKYEKFKMGPINDCDPGFDSDIFSEKQKGMMDAVWNAYGIHSVQNIENPLIHGIKPDGKV